MPQQGSLVILAGHRSLLTHDVTFLERKKEPSHSHMPRDKVIVGKKESLGNDHAHEPAWAKVLGSWDS